MIIRSWSREEDTSCSESPLLLPWVILVSSIWAVNKCVWEAWLVPWRIPRLQVSTHHSKRYHWRVLDYAHQKGSNQPRKASSAKIQPKTNTDNFKSLKCHVPERLRLRMQLKLNVVHRLLLSTQKANPPTRWRHVPFYHLVGSCHDVDTADLQFFSRKEWP